MVVHSCNPGTGEPEAGGSGVQAYPLLHSKFEVSLGYVRHYLKNKNHIKGQQLTMAAVNCYTQ